MFIIMFYEVQGHYNKQHTVAVQVCSNISAMYMYMYCITTMSNMLMTLVKTLYINYM